MAAAINFLKIYFVLFFTKKSCSIFLEKFSGRRIQLWYHMFHALDMLSKIQYGGHWIA